MRVHQKLWSVSFQTRSECADALSVVFDDALATTVLAPPRRLVASVEGIYSSPPELASLAARLTILCLVLKLPLPDLELKELPSLDWLQKVSEDFPPLTIGRWTVFGAQYAKAVTNKRYGLQIDATSAFGTGEHPTTHGCLLMLDRILKRRRPRNILDMGCGSGILAMAALKSRAGRAVGIDMDYESILVAKENAQKNGLQSRFRLHLGKGYRPPIVKSGGRYDLILANIFAGPLSHMAKDLHHNLKPGGIAILSGLLSYQANQVIAAHRLQKLYVIEHIKVGEWSVLALSRGKRAR